MVKCFEEASQRPVEVDIVARREGDVASCYSDCSFAEKELNWRAHRTLSDMCKDFLLLLENILFMNKSFPIEDCNKISMRRMELSSRAFWGRQFT